MAGIKFTDTIETKLWLWERRYKGVKLPRTPKAKALAGEGLTIAQWEERELALLEAKQKKHYMLFAERLGDSDDDEKHKKHKKGKKHKKKHHEGEEKGKDNDKNKDADLIAAWEKQQLHQLHQKEKEEKKKEKQERNEVRLKLLEEKKRRKEKRQMKLMKKRQKWPVSLIVLEEALISISPKITQLPLISFIQAIKKERHTSKTSEPSSSLKEKMWREVSYDLFPPL